MPEVSLKNKIAPVFHPVHRAVKNEEYTYYWLKGGRSSTKSSFISIELILELLKDELANAIIFMKYSAYLRQAVFEQIQWAINELGLNEYFYSFVSPLKFVYAPTGQVILFRGLDDANKTKSIKIAKGYFKIVWFEELSEFDNWEEIRTTLNSVFRKSNEYMQPHFSVFLSYNPPRDPKNWVNIEARYNRPDRLINHSTYLDVPRAWLTDAFIQETETLKQIDERAYRHEYLGEVIGLDGLVYPMFDRTRHVGMINDNERVWSIILGLDEGSINDPTTCVALCVTTEGRIFIPLPFVYDPTIPGHMTLPHMDQAVLINAYVDGLIKRFNYYDNLGHVGTITGFIDSSESGQQLGICINIKASEKGLPLQIAPVSKKDIIADVQRVRGLLSMDGYCLMENGPYISPLTGAKLGDESQLIVEIEGLITDEKTGKPRDGNDHCENALRYASLLLKQQGGL